jgi:hypothetical protein
LAMLGLTLYALAVELGALRVVAGTFAAVFVSIPVVIQPALQETMPDAFMLACFAAGVLFGLSYLRTARRSELVLCGLGLGLAAGTKWYGVSSVLALTATAAVALLIAGRPLRRLAGELALLAGVGALAGGFWFLRNAVASGNPVFPIEVAPLGITIFDAPRDTIREMAGFSVADYATDIDVWRTYLLPALWKTLRAPGLVAACGLVLSLWIWLRRLRAAAPAAGPERAAAARGAVLAVAALLLAGVYAITPYSALGPEGMPVQADANTRYLLPAILLATVLAAATLSGAPRYALAGQAVALAALADALLNGVDPSVSRLILVAAALAVTLVLVITLMPWSPAPLARRRRARLIFAVAFGGIAFLLALVAGREVQRRIDSAPYRGADIALDGVLERDGARVALAGEWDNLPPAPPFPAFGPTLDNEVTYAGPLVDDMLRRYPRPEPFLRRLVEERTELLLVGRSGPPATVAREARWARQAGWQVLAASPRLFLLAKRAR